MERHPGRAGETQTEPSSLASSNVIIIREYVEDVDKEMDLWLVVHPSKKWVFYSNGLNILSL